MNLSLSSDVKNIDNTAFSIYPNPNNGIFNVSFNNELKNAKLELVNVQGQVVFVKNIDKNKEQLNLSHLNAGVYYVRLSSEEEVKIEKIIIK